MSKYFVSNVGQDTRVLSADGLNGGKLELTEEALDQVAGGFAGPTFAGWIRPQPSGSGLGDLAGALAAMVVMQGLFHTH
jgi:hypothetical protein